MTSQLLFSLCFFCFLFYSTSAFEFNFNSTLKSKVPVVSSFNITQRLGSSLSFFLHTSNTSTNFTFCARQNVQPSQNPYYWGTQCTIHAELTNPDYSAEIDSSNIAPGQYFFGLASNKFGAVVELSITGTDCQGSMGPDCTITPQIAVQGSPMNIVLDSPTSVFYGELPIWHAVNPQNMTFTMVSGGDHHYDVLFTLGTNVLPDLRNNHTVKLNDSFIGPNVDYVIGNSTVSLSYASPKGDYFFAMRPVEKKSRSGSFLSRSARRRSQTADPFSNVTVTFDYQLNECPSSKFGSKCENVTRVNTTATNFGPTRVLQTPAGQWDYFSIRTENATAPFSISVQNYDGPGVAPPIYLKYDQVPTTYSYDATSSQLNVNSIGVGQHRTGRWFVGVLGTGAKYALWFNSACPNGCSDHGSCVPVDDQTHSQAFKCECNDDYELFDCSNEKSSGLKSGYVALILVGYLVGLTIGLVLMLWVCHRKKPAPVSYEAL